MRNHFMPISSQYLTLFIFLSKICVTKKLFWFKCFAAIKIVSYCILVLRPIDSSHSIWWFYHLPNGMSCRNVRWTVGHISAKAGAKADSPSSVKIVKNKVFWFFAREQLPVLSIHNPSIAFQLTVFHLRPVPSGKWIFNAMSVASSSRWTNLNGT